MKKIIMMGCKLLGALAIITALVMLIESGFSEVLLPRLLGLLAFGLVLNSIGNAVARYISGIKMTSEMRKTRISEFCFAVVVVGVIYAAYRIYMGRIADGADPTSLQWRFGLTMFLLALASFSFAHMNNKKYLGAILKSGAIDPFGTVKRKDPVILNADERRFSLMVEKISLIENELHVTGNLRGEIHVGDEIVILTPKGKQTRTRVRVLKNAAGSLDRLKDEEATLVLGAFSDLTAVQRYDVISSVLPGGEKSDEACENPYLFGVSYEYDRLKLDRSYMDCYVEALVHSRFVVPVVKQITNVGPEDAPYAQKARIGFMSVIRKGSAGEVKTLPLFTDMETLKRWKQQFEGGHSPDTMVITFQDAVRIMWKGHQGIVLNPFGPVFIHMPSDMVDIISKQEVYRNEFGAPGEKGLSFDQDDDDTEE